MCIVACTQDRSDLMAVTTINLDEFLPKKLDGEVVTAEDWNKLVALFQALNSNALELLDLTKAVDINTANIATLTLGAIPDRSIGSNKLEIAGNTKQVYQITTDTVPKDGVTYYTVGESTFEQQLGLSVFNKDTLYYELDTIYIRTTHETPQPETLYYILEDAENIVTPEVGAQGPEGVYISQPNLVEFVTNVVYYELKAVHQLTVDQEPQAGKTYYTQQITTYTPHTDLTGFDLNKIYYTLNTVATKAAIAEAEVIEDGVIPGVKLKENTLFGSLFTDTVIGSLLNDKVTVYRDKGISGRFTGKEDTAADINETQTHTITFDKAHKALLVITAGTISLYMADPSKPDLHFGDAALDRHGVCFRTIFGPNKNTQIIQTTYEYGATFSHQWYAGYPYNLCSSQGVCLKHANYDYSTKTLTTVFQRAGDYVNQAEHFYGYSFGSLIIGL